MEVPPLNSNPNKVVHDGVLCLRSKQQSADFGHLLPSPEHAQSADMLMIFTLDFPGLLCVELDIWSADVLGLFQGLSSTDLYGLGFLSHICSEEVVSAVVMTFSLMSEDSG